MTADHHDSDEEPASEELARPRQDVEDVTGQGGVRPHTPIESGGELVVRARYRGPIPPPSMLQGYEDVVPGSANRILRMAERHADHSLAMERQAQRYALVVILAVLAVGGFLIYEDKNVEGLVLLLGGLTGLIGTALYARYRESTPVPYEAPNRDRADGAEDSW